jgi:hypothetical protein
MKSARPAPVASLSMALLLATSGLPAAGACRLDKVAELPVTMQQGLPVVTAQVNGTAVPFIVDTGAASTLLSTRTAAALHLAVNPADSPFGPLLAVNGSTWINIQGAIVTLSVPGLSVPHHNIAVTDIAVPGLLAQDFLRRGDVNDFRVLGDVEYDLAHGVIRLWHSRGCSHRELAYWTRSAPAPVSALNIDIETEGPARRSTARNPYTLGEVHVNGTLAVALFDTGSPFSMLSVHTATRAGIGPGSAGVVPQGRLAIPGGQPLDLWTAQVGSFRIGSEEITNTHLHVGEFWVRDRHMLRRIDMVLGADFFRSHHLYIASSQGELIFTANSSGDVFNVSTGGAAQD